MARVRVRLETHRVRNTYERYKKVFCEMSESFSMYRLCTDSVHDSGLCDVTAPLSLNQLHV